MSDREERIRKAYEARCKRQKTQDPNTHSNENITDKIDAYTSKNSTISNKWSKWIGVGLGILQCIISIVFIICLLNLNMLPDMYFYLVVFIICLLDLCCVFGQIFSKKHAIIGKIIIIFTIIILSVGSFYLYRINHTVTEISSNGTSVKLDNMVVAVLNDNSAENILDATDFTFAVQKNTEDGNDEALEIQTQTTVDEIESILEHDINLVEYESLQEEMTALINGEADAMIYNAGYMDIIEEVDPELASSFRVIYEYGIEIEMEVPEVVDVVVEAEPFSVYISGIDVFGAISTNSRSDVNIIATVNPQTGQILLVTTPRDYYVTFPGVTGNSCDKLTHAGIYGVDVSMSTLENIYDTEIKFYARVNFTSLIEMVDALGGISVYSDQTFTTTPRSGVTVNVVKGYNTFDGIQALNFARERYNVDGGDYQRGQNHLEVVKAMVEKATSPAIITSANQLLNSVVGNLDTNMTTSQIQELIKMQISTGMEWEINTMAAEATGGSNWCYSYSGNKLFVAYPVESSVAEISEAMKAVLNGETVE